MIRVAPGAPLGAVVQALLDFSRMTQAQLAEASGYAEGQISKWRRDIVAPTTPVPARLAHAAGYDLALIPREDA